MTPHRYIVCLVLVFIMLHCYGDAWFTVKLDTRASVAFPALPDSSTMDGRKVLIVKTSTHAYKLEQVSVKERDPENNYLDLAYSGFYEGLEKMEGVQSLSERDNTFSKLPAKLFRYKTNIDGVNICTQVQALYFDGTLYTLSCSSVDSAGLYDVESTRFFSSFSIKTDARTSPVNSISTATDIDFIWGHLVFAACFAVLAFTLYFIWTRNNPSRLT